MKKILVCGGRDYADLGRLTLVLNAVREQPYEEDVIIHGDAPGADSLAGQYARACGLPEVKVPANWTFYGNRAGPIRNGWMLRLAPDEVIAFPGGTGTQNMVDQAWAAGIPVRKVDW